MIRMDTTFAIEISISVQKDESGPGEELSNIAAEAASLQPKGYTLQTAEVSS